MPRAMNSGPAASVMAAATASTTTITRASGIVLM